MSAGHADQGLASVSLLGGGQRLVTRGNADLPALVRAAGWWHIGDPGSTRGYLVDALQGAPSMRAKLFVLTAPDGHRSEWLHRLTPGEMINNSFAAVTPSGRWLVSGEWGTMRRLLVFPMPYFNPLARIAHNLPLVGTIRLSRPVRNVQGCSFASSTELVCSTNDPGDDLFSVARQLLGIRLRHPLDGHTQTGTPALLGAVPQASWCGTSEVEGIDVHAGTLRVLAHEPGTCNGEVDVFTYRLRSTTVTKRSRWWGRA
jgi:hypothetical protein